MIGARIAQNIPLWHTNAGDIRTARLDHPTLEVLDAVEIVEANFGTDPTVIGVDAIAGETLTITRTGNSELTWSRIKDGIGTRTIGRRIEIDIGARIGVFYLRAVSAPVAFVIAAGAVGTDPVATVIRGLTRAPVRDKPSGTPREEERDA